MTTCARRRFSDPDLSRDGVEFRLRHALAGERTSALHSYGALTTITMSTVRSPRSRTGAARRRPRFGAPPSPRRSTKALAWRRRPDGRALLAVRAPWSPSTTLARRSRSTLPSTATPGKAASIGCALARVELAHRCVGIECRRAEGDEHRRDRRLTHRDRAGQPGDDHRRRSSAAIMSASMSARSSGVTAAAGRTSARSRAQPGGGASRVPPPP